MRWFRVVMMTGLLFGMPSLGQVAPRLIEGVVVYQYNDKDYFTADAACRALLRYRDPPEVLHGPARSNPYGNVGCTGIRPDGTVGFNQEGTAVQRLLRCPEGTVPNMPIGDVPTHCRCDLGPQRCAELQALVRPAPVARLRKVDDRCLFYEQAAGEEPDHQACPLTTKAWYIKRLLHVSDPRRWSVAKLQRAITIAVNEGEFNGRKRQFVTTNNLEAHQAMQGLMAGGWGNWNFAADLGLAPVEGEHAEDTAVRTFNARGGNKGQKLKIGSDPKPCAVCNSKYRDHSFVQLERLPP